MELTVNDDHNHVKAATFITHRTRPVQLLSYFPCVLSEHSLRPVHTVISGHLSWCWWTFIFNIMDN